MVGLFQKSCFFKGKSLFWHPQFL